MMTTATLKHNRLIDLGRKPQERVLPRTLGAFVWHFLRQIWGFLLVLLVLEGALGFLQAMIPVLLGWLVTDLTSGMLPEQVLAEPWLLGVGVPVIVGWAAILITLFYLYDHHYNNRFNNLIRLQLGGYTLGQSLAYFQNDFAGRIANKVLEGGPALRDPTRSAIGSVWYAAIFSVTSVMLMLKAHVLLAVPAMLWLVLYVASLVYFVPRVKALSVAHTRNHTRLVGHVNDTFTNILSVKLFAREGYEQQIKQDILEEHSDSLRKVGRKVWTMSTLHIVMNVLLMTTTPAIALTLWKQGQVTPGAIAMVLPMVWQIINQSGWIRHEVTRIFEDLGRVEECMETIAKPYSVVDRPAAKNLTVAPGGGTVRFEGVSFHYGKEAGIIEGLNLEIPAGQRVGVVGRSGAGKSTLVSLLLRFYDVERGRISVDGQDIAMVTQDSLRQHIGMVTQDALLMHRSVADNIRLAKPWATDAEVVEAAKRAHAHEFILNLEDKYGRRGYDAFVGERGVKLSGGQRQRIAIARVILENAPILILDEATSALDSEVEAAIQEEMQTVMTGKTTLAIAHRLSTIAQMDRLIVMDQGCVVEDGTHEELLAKGGIYSQLWQRQSGGFLGHD